MGDTFGLLTDSQSTSGQMSRGKVLSKAKNSEAATMGFTTGYQSATRTHNGHVLDHRFLDNHDSSTPKSSAPMPMEPPVRHQHKITDFAQLGRAIDSFKEMTRPGGIEGLFNMQTLNDKEARHDLLMEGYSRTFDNAYDFGGGKHFNDDLHLQTQTTQKESSSGHGLSSRTTMHAQSAISSQAQGAYCLAETK